MYSKLNTLLSFPYRIELASSFSSLKAWQEQQDTLQETQEWWESMCSLWFCLHSSVRAIAWKYKILQMDLEGKKEKIPSWLKWILVILGFTMEKKRSAYLTPLDLDVLMQTYVELNLHWGKQNKTAAVKEIGESCCWSQCTSGNVF